MRFVKFSIVDEPEEIKRKVWSEVKELLGEWVDRKELSKFERLVDEFVKRTGEVTSVSDYVIERARPGEVIEELASCLAYGDCEIAAAHRTIAFLTWELEPLGGSEVPVLYVCRRGNCIVVGPYW